MISIRLSTVFSRLAPAAEIVTSPYKSELYGRLVLHAVVRVNDIFVQQFQIEDILVVRRVETVVETD